MSATVRWGIAGTGFVAGLFAKGLDDAPGARLVVYFAPNTDQGFLDGLAQAIHDATNRPSIVSVSWGGPESSWTAQARNALNGACEDAAAMGISITVAAGDQGATDGVASGALTVDFPASSPFVLSVGGTMLTGTPPQEAVWWEAPGYRAGGGGSTGGGVSTVFPRPAWQAVQVASLNAGSIDGRVIPDIAALAGPPLYDLIFEGQDSPNGGTSAATPLWAALLARIAAGLPAAKQLRFLTPLLYGTAQNGQPVGQAGCTDITSGDNHNDPGTNGQPSGVPGYAAGLAYDAVTGWGTPIGTQVQQLLA